MFPDSTGGGRPLVKICGITNAADARASIDAGADVLGINCFRGSKRYVDIFAAASWLSDLPLTTRNIAVVVNPTWEEATELAGLPFIGALQLHGTESQAFCARLAAAGIPFGKALPATDENAIAAAPLFSTATVVLDSSKSGQFGGTGTTFPWARAREVAAAHPELRVVVAGGLTPENVAEAVRTVRPFGVDVTTGVESSAGRKDHAKLRAFIEAARAAA